MGRTVVQDPLADAEGAAWVGTPAAVLQRVADGGALDRDRKVEGMERRRGATRPDGPAGEPAKKVAPPSGPENGWGVRG